MARFPARCAKLRLNFWHSDALGSPIRTNCYVCLSHSPTSRRSVLLGLTMALQRFAQFCPSWRFRRQEREREREGRLVRAWRIRRFSRSSRPHRPHRAHARSQPPASLKHASSSSSRLDRIRVTRINFRA